jgi:3,4-dehydroadipyl-CoA semialdehyde dehydrogenase
LAKDFAFASQHVMVPTRGIALFINAFNFPSWGLWEKAAPALLSGVPVVVKPATATAWLTQRMVADVVAAGIWPEGSLSVICGGSGGLLDALEAFDVLSFTGSAETAALIRSHRAVTERSVRVNIEADSLNSALLMPDAAPGTASFDLLVREVVREMTVKSGQKCTAIRRVFVPEAAFDAASQAIADRLAKVTVGNPRNETVRMGALVSRQQHDGVLEGISALATEAKVIVDGRNAPLIDADPAISACIGPTLLGLRESSAAWMVHEREVFGPVATILTYRTLDDARAQLRRGGGSLVASLFGAEAGTLAETALDLAAHHGRVHVVDPTVASVQSGHGNVMPQSLHGGPGRAGGGEELGGLRALNFYHRRSAIQSAPGPLDQFGALKSVD